MADSLTSFVTRSPWTNTYHPALEDGTAPSERLRELEMSLNSAFEVYLSLSVAVPLHCAESELTLRA